MTPGAEHDLGRIAAALERLASLFTSWDAALRAAARFLASPFIAAAEHGRSQWKQKADSALNQCRLLAQALEAEKAAHRRVSRELHRRRKGGRR